MKHQQNGVTVSTVTRIIRAVADRVICLLARPAALDCQIRAAGIRDQSDNPKGDK